MQKWKNNLITFSGTLVLTFLLSLFLTSDISLFAFMSKLNVANDFHISDFYSRVVNEENPKLDENIAIIDIAGCSRSEIADIIAEIETYNPAAIGIDILFKEKSDSVSDNKLVNAINSCENIVLATFAGNATSGEYARSEYFSDSISDKNNYGNVALETTSKLPTGVVRNFRFHYPAGNSGSLPSFAAQLVKKAFPDKYAENAELNYIYYPGQDYYVYTPTDMTDFGAEMKDRIKGRIVLLGNYSGNDDLHRTPISEATYGLRIHAAIISTILSNHYVTEIPSYGSWLIAILICTMIILLKLALQTKKYGAFAVRICQILLIALSVLIGCYIFKDLRIVIDINKIVLMLLLGILSMDIWTGIYGFYSDMRERKKLKHTKQD